ncbi:MAG: Icc protein [Planctomycetota bacterium]|jgi:Icc protein
MTRFRLTRRQALLGTCIGAAGSLLPGEELQDHTDVDGAADAGLSSLRFGVITDVHQDVMHDAVERITSFTSTMKARGVDFVIQLGDFCQPKPANDDFLAAWNSFEGSRHHVIGNHDMDGGFSREQVVAYYGMPASYYSFDTKGLHCIVLDGNDPGGASGGYARFIGKEQLSWLRNDLEANPLPTIVFVHQPLDSSDGVDNRAEVRGVLESAKRMAGHPGVIAVFSGHSHVDYSRLIKNIYYTLINSASYVWVGSDHRHLSYGAEVHEKHEWIDRTCPFREPIWGVVTIDLAGGSIEIEGVTTDWVGPDPIACGVDPKNGFWGWDPKYSVPRVSNWRFPLQGQGDIDG